MNYTERSVAAFRAYAEEMLDEQITELKAIENSFLISGKLARIKIFNNHLNVMKLQLEEEAKTLLAGTNDAAQREQLEVNLNALCAEYINEYMCISFLRDDT